MGYRLCNECRRKEKKYSDISNGKHNGTPEHYAALRESYARKKNRPLDAETLIPLQSRLSNAHFKSLLEPFSCIFKYDQSRILVWDTECDGVGGTNTLPETREWFFHCIQGQTLHIRRYLDDNPIKSQRIPNPDYTDHQAAHEIFQIIQNYDYIIAFEPKGCDRNRLKSLFDSVDISWYPAVAKKFLDLQRNCIKLICHTKHQDKSKVYLPGLGLDDVWTYLLDNSSQVPGYFVETDDSWSRLANGISQKCRWDVHRTLNVYLFVRNYYGQ